MGSQYFSSSKSYFFTVKFRDKNVQLALPITTHSKQYFDYNLQNTCLLSKCFIPLETSNAIFKSSLSFSRDQMFE